MYQEGHDLMIECIPGANRFTAEVKGRAADASPMRTLNKWRRHDPDLLFVKEDRRDPLVVMSWAAYERLLGEFDTELLLNAIGFYICHQPSPILVLQPTLSMGQAFSMDRLAPMIRDTPGLVNKVMDARSRDANNTTLHKGFPGGYISNVSANSAAGLASRPIRVVLADEIDRYPPSAGSEGDPVSLAKKRTAAFHNRKLVLTSTPTIKGSSPIEAAYEASDQRRYFVACADCGEADHLKWANVRWPEHRPREAATFASIREQWVCINPCTGSQLRR